MASDFLTSRKNALEESFFARENEKLLEQLRRKASLEARRKALSETSGITDDNILDQLINLDIHSETLAAFSLVPLVEVAWADGHLDQKERDAVVTAAEKDGLPKEGPVHELLQNWLERKPDGEMLRAWKNYARALAADLTPEARQTLRENLMERARHVAQAAGGFLGLGKVSSAERRLLEELEQAFS